MSVTCWVRVSLERWGCDVFGEVMGLVCGFLGMRFVGTLVAVGRFANVSNGSNEAENKRDAFVIDTTAERKSRSNETGTKKAACALNPAADQKSRSNEAGTKKAACALNTTADQKGRPNETGTEKVAFALNTTAD